MAASVAARVAGRPPGEKVYVAGEWRPAGGGGTYARRSPMRPSELVFEAAAASEQDTAVAVEAAAGAFASWAALPLARRGAYLNAAASALEARAERVAEDMALEMGKPLREARMEAARGAQVLRYGASQAFLPVGEHFEQAATGAQVSTRRRPLGVVGLITPWNFPCAIPVWKLAPALVFGNTVVLKLASDAPLTGLHLAACFEEAGLPPGVLNVLTGSGSVVGGALVRDPRIEGISFTGSVETGETVRDTATRSGKKVQLELGGHNPLVVMADADLSRAAEAAYAGAFWSAGQKCTATRRIYVERPAYAEFRKLFLERIARGKVGDPLDPEVEVGPLVSESQLADVVAGIEHGESEGGRIVAGGERLDPDGYLLAPTVFEDVADDSFLACEEVFGPVVSLAEVASLDEALERANATRFGLSAAIFTSSLRSATRFQNEAQAGLIHVNSQTAGADVHVPFGGLKGSGFGPHEQGRAALDFYTELVTVYVDP
jgi:aldehyde dehydrogenase (NAD+)